jgi:hypothetical protein
VHAVEELHDTAVRNPLVVAGLGTDLIAQLVPFQASASIFVLDVLSMKSPTAVHDVAVGHDTPFSSLTSAPGWFRVVWIAQLVPFHLSASIEGGTSKPVLAPPTAVQAVAAVHDTPENWT